MTELVALDIGGTHARFALAAISDGGTISVADPVTLETSDFASLEAAWHEFELRCAAPLPRAAAIAIAAPITGKTVRMTNNSWVVDVAALDQQLDVDAVTVINDFGAVAHTVARAGPDEFIHLAGPDQQLPDSGTISVIGPGTGLGVAHLHRFSGGYHIQATEGGHVGFAPNNDVEDLILARLRQRYPRVSVERVVSGPGIIEIHAALAAMEHHSVEELDDRTIWQRGIARKTSLATAAVEHFCMMLGSVVGDYALAHGASAVVIAGGLGYRLRDVLRTSRFAERFTSKGRYEQMMQGLPVKLITHPEPGLFGAVAAFQREFCPEFCAEF